MQRGANNIKVETTAVQKLSFLHLGHRNGWNFTMLFNNLICLLIKIDNKQVDAIHNAFSMFLSVYCRSSLIVE